MKERVFDSVLYRIPSVISISKGISNRTCSWIFHQVKKVAQVISGSEFHFTQVIKLSGYFAGTGTSFPKLRRPDLRGEAKPLLAERLLPLNEVKCFSRCPG